MFDKLFSGFSDVKDFLDVTGNAVSQKAAAAKETAKVAEREATNVAGKTHEYEIYAQDQLQRLKGIEAQGVEARRMANGGIFDRISLIGDQILNPQAYTRAGREGQISEISQDLSLRGQIVNIEAASAEARVNVAKAHEAAATVDLDTGLLKVKTQIDALALANQAIVNTESLRTNNLATTDLPVLQQSLIGPTPPDGKITLNGFKYSTTEIKERTNALQNREKLAFLSPQATDPDFASKLSVSHQMQLSTYTLGELETLRANGLTMPDGTKVMPNVWEDAYNREQRVQADQIAKMQADVAIKNALPGMLKDSQLMIDAGSTYINPGSPAAAAQTQFKAAMQTVATIAEKNVTPQAKAAQMQALQQAQTTYVNEIQKEAKRKAGGDEKLASIYANQMLGQPISQAQVQDLVTERYIKFKGFGDVLPKETSTKLQKFADQELAVLQQENAQADLNPMGGTKRSPNEMRQEAMLRAYDKVSADTGVDGMNKLQAISVQRKDNPGIQAGLAPGSLMEIQRRASEIGVDNVAKAYSLNGDQIAAIKAGRFADAGLDPARAQQIAGEINIQSTAAEYDLLDAQKPGLGYAMQQWYIRTMPDMARNYTANMDPTQQALIGDAVLNEASKFVDTYTAVDENAVNRGSKVAAAMMTGAKKPINFWPVMLQTDDRLADSQKQEILYSIIFPTLESANAKGLNEEQATELVFNTISNYKNENNPTLTAAVKNFSRGLPKSLDNFEKTWQVLAAQKAYYNTPGGPQPVDQAGVFDRQRAMQWDFDKDYDSATRHMNAILPWTRRDNKQQ